MDKTLVILIILFLSVGGITLFLAFSGYEFGKSYKITLESKGLHLTEIKNENKE